MLAPIPNWNAQGVVPPVDPQNPTSPLHRSPYSVSLAELVQRYATSPERETILGGLLSYRAAIHQAGLVAGFQWLDGSFLENKELLHSQPPGDIDVVTYYQLAPGQTQVQVGARDPFLFGGDINAIKQRYHVDAYFVSLQTAPELLISQSNYWYGMWSHQRQTLMWKGFLQIDLAPGEDANAAQILQPAIGGATP